MKKISLNHSMHVNKKPLLVRIFKSYQLYLLLIPTLVYFAIFHYGPMYGVLISFKNFKPHLGILGSPWVGFNHFLRFFRSNQFERLIKNTLGLSFLQLIAGFPLPVLLALALNYVNNKRFKKLVQTITYAPHFISTVVIVGMLVVFLSAQNGIVNNLIRILGGETVGFLARPEWFKPLYVLSDIWKNMGWNSIIYLAALSAIDQQLYEAATVDGASKLKRIWHIDLPGIAPTVITLLIMNLGKVMTIGFEKAYLMQNSLNISSSEIIATYIYKIGLLSSQYSYSAAIGLFNNIINLILLVTVNRISRKVSESSLW